MTPQTERPMFYWQKNLTFPILVCPIFMMINQQYKMKFVLIIAIIVNFNSILAQCEDGEYSTIGVLDDINEEIYNNDESVNA